MRIFLSALMFVFLMGCATKEKAQVIIDSVKEKTTVVNFKFNSFKLQDEQKKVIYEAVRQSKDGSKVTIVGYTDSQGSKAYNKQLSKKRAQAVAKYLDTLKVANSWAAGGESRLLNKDKTKAEHAANRRAEIGFVVEVK